MNTGDYADWVGAIATSGALLFAFIQLGIEKRAAHKRNIKLQSSQISCWITKPYDYPMGISISNSSNEPIFEAVISVVAIQGSAIYDALEAPQDYSFRKFIGVIPPGKYHSRIETAGHGMNIRLSLEIAFTDSLGNNWVRKGNGQLKRVKEPAVNYYSLPKPLPWDYVDE